MPEIMTTTGYEKRITEYAAAHGHEIGRSKAQRLALKLCKRQAKMTDLELERILTHSDPTPQKAFRNLRDANHPLITSNADDLGENL